MSLSLPLTESLTMHNQTTHNLAHNYTHILCLLIINLNRFHIVYRTQTKIHEAKMLNIYFLVEVSIIGLYLNFNSIKMLHPTVMKLRWNSKVASHVDMSKPQLIQSVFKPWFQWQFMGNYTNKYSLDITINLLCTRRGNFCISHLECKRQNSTPQGFWKIKV